MHLFNLTTLNRILFLLLLLTGGVCKAGDGFYGTGAVTLCKIPEDPVAFMAVVASDNNGKITADDLKVLLRHLQVEKDEQIIYPAYSKSEKVRFVVLSKACTASDGVDYHFYISSFTDSTGNAVFSQYYLAYQYADILDEKRNISHPTEGDFKYGKLTVQRRVGLLDSSHLGDYMKNSSCSTLTDENISSDQHPYKLLILASTPVSYCLDPDAGTKEPLKDAVICDSGNFHIFLSRFLESKDLQRKHIKRPFRYASIAPCADYYGMDAKQFAYFREEYPNMCPEITIKSLNPSPMIEKMTNLFHGMWNQHTFKKRSWLLSVFVSDSEAEVHAFKPGTGGQSLYFFEHTDCWRLSGIENYSL